MKGLVKYEHGPVNMEVREMPIPEPDSGEVRVEIRAAGICGTDIHIYKDEYPYNPPVIMGHEFSGIVDEVAGTDEFRPGEAVTRATLSFNPRSISNPFVYVLGPKVINGRPCVARGQFTLTTRSAPPPAYPAVAACCRQHTAASVSLVDRFEQYLHAFFVQ